MEPTNGDSMSGMTCELCRYWLPSAGRMKCTNVRSPYYRQALPPTQPICDRYEQKPVAEDGR